MNYKQAFYSRLEDCYMGVKIKDFHKNNIAQSGFSNLLNIKEKYFQHIKAYLDSQIEKEPLSHDIYNKLYTLFSPYLAEGECFNIEVKDSKIYKGKDYTKAEKIIDYNKSRKDFDIFYTLANLMGWQIKRLFLDSKGVESCEFDNGKIIAKDCLDLAKYPKLKNLIWWE